MDITSRPVDSRYRLFHLVTDVIINLKQQTMLFLTVMLITFRARCAFKLNYETENLKKGFLFYNT